MWLVFELGPAVRIGGTAIAARVRQSHEEREARWKSLKRSRDVSNLLRLGVQGPVLLNLYSVLVFVIEHQGPGGGG